MKKKIGLILYGILIICCFFGCRKTYNLNKYTENEVIDLRIDDDGKFIKPLFAKIKEGSIIKYKGVVNSFDTGYDENGNEVYFYRIQPIYKGSNLKYASEGYIGLAVLSPLEEVNRDYSNFHNYLEKGDIVSIKGRKVERGKYYTSKEYVGENKGVYKFDYIEAEKIEVIGNVNKLLEDETIHDDDDL